MRTRIIAAAHQRFRLSGYAATSVADVAADLQVAPTYLYKFFKSKRVIGEAVCASILDEIYASLQRLAASEILPRDKILGIFRLTLRESIGMFFAERKLHDLVAQSLEQSWSCVDIYKKNLHSIFVVVLQEGLSKGVFDPSIDVAETAEALFWALVPFAHPRVLEQSLDGDLAARAAVVGRFCLRSIEAK